MFTRNLPNARGLLLLLLLAALTLSLGLAQGSYWGNA